MLAKAATSAGYARQIKGFNNKETTDAMDQQYQLGSQIYELVGFINSERLLPTLYPRGWTGNVNFVTERWGPSPVKFPSPTETDTRRTKPDDSHMSRFKESNQSPHILLHKMVKYWT